ncbi:MAG: dTDP-4-dehydrorhamnose reductase [Candidatus Pacearchaeota archaeon]
MKKRTPLIAIIGANGQLGRDLVISLKQKNFNVIPVYHTSQEGIMLDISNKMEVFSFVNNYKPNIIINTAAFHKVDLCEEQPKKAFEVNCLGVENLVKAISSSSGIRIINISTDYIFDGERGWYSEDDLPNPINIYGESKLLGERVLKNNLEEKDYLILRVQALQGRGGSSVKGQNFVETMIKLGKERGLVKVVKDQITKPSFTKDLAEAIGDLIKIGAYGIYNLTNEGSSSWYDFAKQIFKDMNMNVDCIPITTEEASVLFKYKAKRPLNTTLSTKKIEDLKIKLRPWQDSLKEYIKNRTNGI